MAALSTFLATPTLLLKLKPPSSLPTETTFPPLTLSTRSLSSQNPITLQTRPRIRRPYAASIDSPVTEAVAADTASDIVSATADSSGDGVSVIISALLFVAFLGLSILTIGVIYLAVTDFLQKREREKLEKEEEAKRKKKGGKKGRVRARAGPKGFGQKNEDEEDDV